MSTSISNYRGSFDLSYKISHNNLLRKNYPIKRLMQGNNKPSKPFDSITWEVYQNHIKMQQIYIITYLFEKFDSKIIQERIEILEKKFKLYGIQNYDMFMKYVSIQENSQCLPKDIDENSSIILIEFYALCKLLIQYMKQIQENQIINLLKQYDSSLQPILTCLLVSVLEDDRIKQQVPELQNQIIKFRQSLSCVRQTETQLQKQVQQFSQQQAIQKTKGDKSYKILVIGASGTGKTTLANKLVSKFFPSTSIPFNLANNIDGGSIKLEFQSFTYKNIHLDILDSPGFGNIETNIQNMMKDICKLAKRINMILYCFNSTILRYSRQDLLVISILQGLYFESWDNFFVCLNFLDLIEQNNLPNLSFQILESINKRLKSNIPSINFIYNDENVCQTISKIIEEQYNASEYKQGFKRRTIPNIQLIQTRYDEYSL